MRDDAFFQLKGGISGVIGGAFVGLLLLINPIFDMSGA